MIKTIPAGSTFYRGAKDAMQNGEKSASLDRQPRHYADPLAASYDMVSSGTTLYRPSKPSSLSQEFTIYSALGSPLNEQLSVVKGLLEHNGYTFRTQPVAGSDLMTVSIPQFNGRDVKVTSRDIIELACRTLGYKFNAEVNFTLYHENGKAIAQSEAVSGYLGVSKLLEDVRLLDLNTPEVKQILATLGTKGVVDKCQELGCVGVYRSESVHTHDSSVVDVPTITMLHGHERKLAGVVIKAVAPLSSNHIDIVNFRENAMGQIGAGSPPPKFGLHDSIKAANSCAGLPDVVLSGDHQANRAKFRMK